MTIVFTVSYALLVATIFASEKKEIKIKVLLTQRILKIFGNINFLRAQGVLCRNQVTIV